MEHYYRKKIKERGMRGSRISYRGFYKDIEGLEEFVTEQVANEDAYENANDYIWAVLNDYEIKKCIICGKSITVRNYRNGKYRFCSQECYRTSEGLEIAKQKRDETNIERYGSLEEAKKTAHENYKQSMIEKYGVDNTLKLQSTIDKRHATMTERYGAATTLQSKELHKKVADTMIEKYGSVCPMANGEILERTKQSNLEKYGVEWISQVEEVKTKGGITHARNRFSKLKRKLDDEHYELISDDLRNKTYGKFRCKKCGNVFENYLYYNVRCLKCYPHIRSEAERELAEFVKSLCVGDVISGDRKLLYPKELDIVVPSKKIAIEYNGLFWHSDEVVDNSYHKFKTDEVEKLGYQLIQIFEDEWIYKKEIVKSVISAKFGKFDRTIGARKCEVRELTYVDVADFLNKNHLQGAVRCKVNLGLFCDDELVSLMTFSKPRFNKRYDWELVRFCSKVGVSVIGGAEKLLKFFDKHYNGSMMSYADRRYSNGALYERLGFTFEGFTNPNYFYVMNQQRLNRMKFQKHKLAGLLENYDANKTEVQNMKEHGYNRVYDCGNRIYVRG